MPTVKGKWSEAELARIEAEHPSGVAAAEIVSLLDVLGVGFSEASLRKYVQLELLPRSVRVGHRGRQGGSQGQYPTEILRQILEIKRLLGEGYGIEEIRSKALLIRHEIDHLEARVRQIVDGMEKALAAHHDTLCREQCRRELREAMGSATDLIRRLRAVEGRRGSGSRVPLAANDGQKAG